MRGAQAATPRPLAALSCTAHPHVHASLLARRLRLPSDSVAGRTWFARLAHATARQLAMLVASLAHVSGRSPAMALTSASCPLYLRDAATMAATGDARQGRSRPRLLRLAATRDCVSLARHTAGPAQSRFSTHTTHTHTPRARAPLALWNMRSTAAAAACHPPRLVECARHALAAATADGCGCHDLCDAAAHDRLKAGHTLCDLEPLHRVQLVGVMDAGHAKHAASMARAAGAGESARESAQQRMQHSSNYSMLLCCQW